MQATNDKDISNSTWMELLETVKYSPKQFRLKVKPPGKAGDYAYSRSVDEIQKGDEMPVVDRLQLLVETVVVTIGFDLGKTPLSQCLHSGLRAIKKGAFPVEKSYQGFHRTVVLQGKDKEEGELATTRELSTVLTVLEILGEYLTNNFNGIMSLSTSDLPGLGAVAEITAQFKSSKEMFKDFKFTFQKWDGTVAGWIDFAIEVRSFMHGHNLKALLLEEAVAKVDLSDSTQQARAALGWLDAMFFEHLRACLHHQHSVQPRNDFVNECRWGYPLAKGSTLWMLLVGAFERIELVEERSTYFENSLMKDKIKDSQNMDLDSLAANKAMVLASYVPLLKPADITSYDKALAVCINKYVGMYESNSVRSNLAQAKTTTEIRASRTKTSNQKAKDIFGSVQYKVGSPAHLTIRRSRPTDTKGRGAPDFFSKRKPLRSDPSAKTVKYKDKNSQNLEPATRGTSKGDQNGEIQEDEPAVAPKDGDASSRKKKMRNKKKRKGPHDATKTSGVAPKKESKKVKKEHGANSDLQTEDEAGKKKYSKKKNRGSRTRRTSAQPNNYLSSYIPGSG